MKKSTLGLLATLLFIAISCTKEKNRNKNSTLPIISNPTKSDITNISDSTATLNITITSDGNAEIIAKGVCWNTTPKPTISNYKTINISPNLSFIANLTGLTARTTYYARGYVTNSLGTVYSDEISFTTSTVTDIDGNVYNTVTIGNQVWMKENLKVTHFRNGDLISEQKVSNEWCCNEYKIPSWCYYNNDSTNNTVYGKLYNWTAVMNYGNGRTIAPLGWHVPTVAEWDTLRQALGGGAIAGGALKATTLWNNPNRGATNSSGFTAYPAGRINVGAFSDKGFFTFYWTSTNYGNGSNPFSMSLCNDCIGVGVSEQYPASGFSIRCIKD